MLTFDTPAAARAALAADMAHLNAIGVYPSARAYMFAGALNNSDMAVDQALAFDAQPGLITPPNSAIPAMMTTLVDPRVIEVVTAPAEIGAIIGEGLRGNWTTQTAMFNLTEMTGEASSYGDENNNGVSGFNSEWPQRQSYIFQTNISVGDLEEDRMAEAKVNVVAQKQRSAANTLTKATDLIYAYGVKGLQNYGLLNDPALSAAITPATKAGGGVSWITSAGVINATANEVYADIQSLFQKVVTQANGKISAKMPMTLAMSPGSEVALTNTNSFNVNVYDLLKKSFPRLEVKTSVRYSAASSSNPQGNAGGNIVQLIVDMEDGQETALAAFNVKLKAHPVVRERSAWTQKWTGGAFGSIIFRPFAISQMIGV